MAHCAVAGQYHGIQDACGNEDDNSCRMPSWMEEDVPSRVRRTLTAPTLIQMQRDPSTSRKELSAEHQDEFGIEAGYQPAGNPLQQSEAAAFDQPPNQPGLVQHPAQQQR
jgi:hypothetical protein